jgi:hypothetical protein
MYTEIELAAMNAADEAFAEVRKVAERFANKINCNYHRTVTDWTSYSSFDVPLFSSRHVSWEPVDHFCCDFGNAEAYECAVALVEKWNSAIVPLKEKRDTRIWARIDSETYNEYEYWDKQVDLVYDAQTYLLEELGKIVEDWYDSASECAYEAYLEEHTV